MKLTKAVSAHKVVNGEDYIFLQASGKLVKDGTIIAQAREDDDHLITTDIDGDVLDATHMSEIDNVFSHVLSVVAPQ